MPNNKLQYIAANIRQRRDSLQYSQFYVAYKIGCGQNAYSKIELGQTRITLDKLFAIAEALETDLMTLITPQDNLLAMQQAGDLQHEQLKSAV